MKKLLIVLLALPLLFSSCYLQNEEQKALTEICENINSACPMMVKDNFEFTSINCRYPKVEMSYRYTDYESNDVYNEVMKALAKKEVEDPINNNEGFSDFREAGYMFVMIYFDKNYKSIFYLLLMKDTDGIYKLIDEPVNEETSNDVKIKDKVELGEYYKPNSHPKAKGLNFQIKTPLGFEQMEADRPNIVQKWIKNRKDSSTVIFGVMVENSPIELQGISQNEWMQYFKYETGVEDFKPQDTHNIKVNINDSKHYVLDNFYGTYYEGYSQAGRVDNEGGSYFIMAQVYLNKHIFSIHMSAFNKDIFDSNKELFRSVANSVIFPDQY